MHESFLLLPAGILLIASAAVLVPARQAPLTSSVSLAPFIRFAYFDALSIAAWNSLSMASPSLP
jgi:hypothetical protein